MLRGLMLSPWVSKDYIASMTLAACTDISAGRMTLTIGLMVFS
jgi:hypothetical protein